ncbi:MAG: hypothetical protein NT136_01460 [Candidatus Moranbacteria bacterium]|nr:hypothetical protein [Candidatus Moranbacteria bacterium]
MHQLLYIGGDEEITSLVDRLRKSKVSENFFVVPKRAMVLQSVVNLKILKKEAEKLKKQIVFVTQDEAGETLARKVGIMVRSNLDGLETAREKDENLTLLSASKQLTGGKEISVRRVDKRERLENIGSQEFFDEEEDKTGKSAKKAIGAVRLPKGKDRARRE